MGIRVIKAETTRSFWKFSPHLVVPSGNMSGITNSSCRMDVLLMLKDTIHGLFPFFHVSSILNILNSSGDAWNVRETPGFVQHIWPRPWTASASSQDFCELPSLVQKG